MTKNKLSSCRSGEDFIRYAEKNGGEVVGGKRHAKVRGEDGICIVPRHRKDLGIGIRKAIARTFAAIGIAVIPIMIIMALFG